MHQVFQVRWDESGDHGLPLIILFDLTCSGVTVEGGFQFNRRDVAFGVIVELKGLIVFTLQAWRWR